MATPAYVRAGILLVATISLLGILTFTYPSLRPDLPAVPGRAESGKGVNSPHIKGDLLDDVLNATLGVSQRRYLGVNEMVLT